MKKNNQLDEERKCYDFECEFTLLEVRMSLKTRI